MRSTVFRFARNEDGAVTVDWVVLTAAIVGLGVAVISTVSTGALDHANGLGADLDAKSVSAY